MTIADNIDFLNEAKKLFEDIANNPSINETIKTYLIIESLESAIGIMHKYKKIEEIVKFGNANELGFEYVGEKITEVMENGSN